MLNSREYNNNNNIITKRVFLKMYTSSYNFISLLIATNIILGTSVFGEREHVSYNADIRPCKQNEFQCASGQCVHKAFVCYGGKNGARFGCADKSHLLNCSKFICRDDQFKCREGYCIDKEQECDRRVDCTYTSSDEHGGCGLANEVMDAMTSHPCSHKDSFQCFPELIRNHVTQECLPANAVCDGVADCSNGWDENVQTCGMSNTLEVVTSHPCSRKDSFVCFPEVKKTEAVQECVPGKAVCDGVADCSNGWDEKVEKCGCMQTEFQCNATTCIDRMLRCDTKDDCLDGRDEMDCETYICPVSHTKCDNHFCVPRHKLCDFVDDCGDGSDEKQETCERRACFSTEFRCNNSQCVSMAYICDGVIDCLDGSDEEWTQCDQHFKCPIGIYVNHNHTCDGWVDCHFTHADELGCNHGCNTSQFQCANGQCIGKGNVCDGVCDCLGCKDEDECDTYACVSDERFRCMAASDSTPRCIDKDRLCDGINDCKNNMVGFDEFYCISKKNCTERKTPTFFCKEGRCLPSSLRCDGVAHCADGDDEIGCGKVSKCKGNEFQCTSGQCIHEDKRCDAIFDCPDRSDEDKCLQHECGQLQARCQSGQCVDLDKWCNFNRDCPDGSDERQCELRPCKHNEFRCNTGQCIDKAFVCYDGKNGAHLGCADKSHLLNCSNFQCADDQFKCREGYCIDQSQECDDTVDCKYTSWDEQNCNYSCPVHSNVCVCKGDLMNCDNIGLYAIPEMHHLESQTTLRFSGNCLQIDRQSFSSSYFGKVTYLDLSNNSISGIPGSSFVSMYRLTLLSLSYNNITSLDADTFKGLSSLKTLHLYGNRIAFFNNETFLPLINLRALDLSGQALTSLDTNHFNGLKKLLTLNLANNSIQSVAARSFGGLQELLSLNLSRNQIESLDYGVFLGMPALKTLDVSSNRIVFIASGVFNGMHQMRFLDISMNRISDLSDNVFLPMDKLQSLITDHHKFCCLAGPLVQCLPEADEFSSCKDLMSNHMLRISIWILGVVALVGNIVVILWRLRDFRGGRVHSFLITNLAIGDLLMGVYLLIIASVDLHYRGVYIIHDEEWRRSDLCRFAGFVSTFSSELSVLTLTTITLDRLLCILFPLKRTRLGLKQAMIVMVLIWAFVLLIAITPVFGFQYFEDFYGRSGVCLALHVTPDRPAGWEYSVAIFLVLNFTSFLIIAASYLWMFIVAKKTRNAVRTSESPNDTAMARRMTIIVMTDFCCWVPIILLGFVSLAGARTDNQVYAWIAVFVLPLNSATNPVLYTLSTAPFLGNVRKRVTVFRKSFINSIDADTKHSYVEDRTTHYCYDKKSPYRQLELIRLRSLNNSTSIGCYSRDHFIDT